MARAKRKDGRYQIALELPLRKGDTTRRRKYFYGKTLTEARQKRDDFLATFNRNQSENVNPDVTLSEWGDVWLSDVRGTYSKNAFNCAVSATRKIVQGLPGLKVREIKPHHIQSYMSTLAGMSKSTINKRRGTLKQLFDYAVDNGVISESPVRGIRSPRGTYTGHRVITEQERNALLYGWRSCSGATWALVMLYTGMRRGELFALTPEDVDFDSMTVRVSKAAVLEDESHLKEPKTKAGIRTVPILEPVVEPLRFAVGQGGERLFLSNAGKPINAVTFRSGWDTMCRLLKINIQAHDLRYSYASMLHDAGIDMLTAAKLLGHADIKITMGIYTKLSNQKERSEIEKLRAWMSNGCQ